MKAQWYAEALHGALKGKNESDASHIIARFSEVIIKRGHKGLLSRIAEELKKISLREDEKETVLLVATNEKGRTRSAFAYESYQREGLFPLDAIPREVIDETIVGGYQLRGKHLLVDQSYKRSLVELYKNIIHKH